MEKTPTYDRPSFQPKNPERFRDFVRGTGDDFDRNPARKHGQVN